MKSVMRFFTFNRQIIGKVTAHIEVCTGVPRCNFGRAKGVCAGEFDIRKGIGNNSRGLDRGRDSPVRIVPRCGL